MRTCIYMPMEADLVVAAMHVQSASGRHRRRRRLPNKARVVVQVIRDENVVQPRVCVPLPKLNNVVASRKQRTTFNKIRSRA